MSLPGLGRRIAAGLSLLAFASGAALAQAQENMAKGAPENWQLGFQPAASDLADQGHDFHNLLLVIITAIVIFVLGLLVWVIVRYNAKANPTPSRNAHNTMLEVAWTVVPVLILLVIAIPSFRLLYAQYDIPPADVTVKATGHQWYWSYSYPDHGNFGFDSLMVEDDALQPGQPRLLTVDNEVVVPVNKVIHVLLTSDDVIHNWALPAFGMKMDAVKGRNTLVWFRAKEPGVYYGQCSELCGARHAFMPITVRVVTDQEFAGWVEQARQKFASSMPDAGTAVAATGEQPKAAAKLNIAANENN